MTEAKDPKSRILARRAKFMLAAMATSVGTACSSSTTSEPQVCLSPIYDGGVHDGDADTGPEPCLGALPDDTGTPEVCLSAPLDSGSEDAATDTSGD